MIAPRARWFHYDDADHHGHLPDPTTSVLAARAVAAGLVTLPSREALEAQLAPDPDDVLARRAELLHNLQHDHETERTEPTAREQVEWIRRNYVHRIADGDTSFSDTDIVRISHALTRPDVRDECLSLLSGPHPTAAETLWTILTRQCPPPACTEAAALLAISAYSRGDGALAGIAIDRALTADPHHDLALVLDEAFRSGMSPHHIRALIPFANGGSV
nr:hypothetical protein GCM10017745_46460 [Saccharothrix mutabilis subsp. capreolus]